ncbi:hypothetical protein DPMN_025644 [Dreissena polymorpha]|uniref:Uncharacterized protein n=1 Tax=Dreissena polymorpha TaxID=45954 RepID=A0A9D4LRG4_DREPO|nr:hypothetical protein DPMN_025644 [Dreissena polymorpha]
MRDDDTEIIFQSGLLCAAESNLSTLLDYPSTFSSDGFDVNLPLACPGEQSCLENRVW